MSLRFHWFLPTNGDGRDIVGGGHGVAILTEATERLKFLVAFRPGLISPTLSAQMAATFQRHSRGRLLPAACGRTRQATRSTPRRT
jgi:alkanesulfonate monooxygenase